MAERSECVLTDDEVVAIVSLTGSSWIEPLQTVDTSEPVELDRAAARGVRALQVRGLLDEDGEFSTDAGLGIAGVHSARRVIAAFVDDAFVPDRLETRLALRTQGKGIWLAETIAPQGLRRYAIVDVWDALDLIAALACSRSETRKLPTFCVVVLDPMGNSVGGLSAGDGQVTALVRAADGGLGPDTELNPNTASCQSYLAGLLGLDASDVPPHMVAGSDSTSGDEQGHP